MDETYSLEAAGMRGNAVLFRVSGRVDARSSARFLDHCLEACAPRANLVVNMAEVTFLSSSGVGALMVLSERTLSQGVRLRLVLSGAAHAPLRLLKLDRFLNIDASEAAALEACDVVDG